ncbi:MAG: electron transfer flavoprotein-ubiquinone oxidoreductase [Candidatus Krumholzibacteria bacterium]|nr:electron transfer flavoprotein-ubiquinone oxidoreductase [Candidatus Krumholzibacteria bacterium]
MSERETLDVDVLFVGAGPGTLASAYHLQQLINAHNERVSSTGEGSAVEPMIAIIEKGREIGAHSFSGAVLDPVALHELVPDFEEKGCPLEKKIDEEDVYYLSKKGAFRLPITPSQMNNHGNYTLSLSKFTRWLGALAEEAGINVFPGFAGVEILEEDSVVTGVRTGDKGIGKNGEKRSNYEPGIDLRAKVTVFGDGSRGYLSKQLISNHKLDAGKATQVYETGVKEVFEMPEGRVEGGRVVHTMGYPFKKDCVGGTWIYYLKDNLLSVGLVTPLDYKDPFINPHEQLQQLKEHPTIAKILEGGKSIAYGAKVITAGGYYSVPKLYTAGALLVGEAGGLVDMSRLKGIHLAMKSGMLAAETILDALKQDDFSEASLAPYEKDVYESYIGRSMYGARHFHRALSLGIPKAFFHMAVQQLTGGRDVLSYEKIEEDRYSFESVAEYHGPGAELPEPHQSDGEKFLDKLSNVYNSGTIHNEDQPCHLKILDTTVCYDTCVDKYRYPCNRFCPANVYEMEKDEDSGNLRLQVSFANCVHCQTCDINCPMDNIRWTPPEGGDGPDYRLM